MKRLSQISRKTNETNINLKINLDGNGTSVVKTEVGFLNHMISLLAFHSNIDIELDSKGDIEVCDHHLIEDIGIALGRSINEALGDKKGIKRYGTFFLPMDESLVMVSLDISGRSYLHFEAGFKRESIGNFSTEMVKEFFRAVAFNAGITLHIKVLYGENDHHKIEAIFKSFARALKDAIKIISDEVASSKGVL